MTTTTKPGAAKRALLSLVIAAGTAGGALAVQTIGAFEGLRTVAYRDSVGVATICYGETAGVRMGQKHTKAECDAMFERRLSEFAGKVEACITRAMPMRVEVAFTSLAYNIGPAGFCKSTAVKLWNAGNGAGSCEALTRFNRAGGKVLAGLTRRRAAERKLCLEGLKDRPAPVTLAVLAAPAPAAPAVVPAAPVGFVARVKAAVAALRA